MTILAQRGTVQAPQQQLTVTVLDVAPPVTPAADLTVVAIAGAVIATGAAGGGYYVLRRRGMKK